MSHRTVKAFYLSSAFWFVIGTFAGLIDATHMAAPDFLGNIPWIVFGRLRPMHTNIVIFGFVGSALLGTAHYLVSALLRAPLFQRTDRPGFSLDLEPRHPHRNRDSFHGVLPEPGICRMDLAGRCLGSPIHGADFLQPLPDGQAYEPKSFSMSRSGMSSGP